MNEFSSRLRAQNHHESREIQNRERTVMTRRSKVKKAVAERRTKLEDCRKLMVFLQDCNEVSVYVKLLQLHLEAWRCGWGRLPNGNETMATCPYVYFLVCYHGNIGVLFCICLINSAEGRVCRRI
jgi:hypothetical protein